MNKVAVSIDGLERFSAGLPRMTRMGTDNKESHAGTPIAWAGGIFADALASKLADGLAKPPLHLLRE